MESNSASDLTDSDRIQKTNQRVEEMMVLYLKWAHDSKLRYRGLNIASIAFAAAVPVIVLVAPLVHSTAQDPWVASVAGILGAFATLTKSVDLFFKDHDTWMRNNDAYGKLRSEHFLFYERAGNYKIDDRSVRISMYADRVQAVIDASSTSWTSTEKTPQGVGS